MTAYEFLRKVENTSNDMTKEQLEEFVYRYAASLDERKRESFLEALICISLQKAVNAESRQKEDKENIDSFLDSLRNSQNKLDAIILKDHWLNSEYNENWNDWYDSYYDEVLFHDYFGLTKDIETAVQMLHKCVDLEQYHQGRSLAEKLVSLKVFVRGDYADYQSSELDIQELNDRNVIDIDFERFVKELVLLTYLDTEGNNRISSIFRIAEALSNYGVTSRAIEKLRDYDLPEYDHFLLDLLEYLGQSNNRSEQILLKTVAAQIKDKQALIPIASKYAVSHPEIFLTILKSGSGTLTDREMMEVGTEALEKIPSDYKIRSEIALLTADHALKSGQMKTAEHCWLEAFRSDTSVTNYLRIRYNTNNWQMIENESRQIINDSALHRDCCDGSIQYEIYVPEKNTVLDSVMNSLMFFEGEFDKAFDGFIKKNHLRYPEGYLSEGSSLFMLILYSGSLFDPAIESIVKRAETFCSFKTESYYLGLNVSEEKRTETVFRKLISDWKNSVSIDHDQKEKWLKAVEAGIEKYVDNTLKAQRRNAYAYCAQLVLELGTVLESLGVEMKKSCMERYKSKYPRHRSFIKELQRHQ